jgi:hypothetical protein
MDELQECLCHDSTNPIQQSANTLRPRPAIPKAVTFAQFARAGRRLGWSLEFLTKYFRSKIEEPGELLGRIFDRRDRHGAMVIPYRSVLEFYHRETAPKRSRARREAPTDARVSYNFSAKTGQRLPAAHPAVES